MRSRLVALRAAGAIAVLATGPVVCAGVARADDPVTVAGGSAKVTVTPSAVVPGGEIEIRVEGCERSPATATSGAFVAEAALTGRDEGRAVPLFGETTIRSSAAPGRYDVSVGCDGRGRAGSSPSRSARRPTAGPWPHPPRPHPPGPHPPRARPGLRARDSSSGRPGAGIHSRLPSVSLFASAPPALPARPAPSAQAGGGSAAHATDDGRGGARESGPGTPETVIGLVLAGVTAVVVAIRSVRRQRAGAKDDIRRGRA